MKIGSGFRIHMSPTMMGGIRTTPISGFIVLVSDWRLSPDVVNEKEEAGE
jgi:hypothetical protein